MMEAMAVYLSSPTKRGRRTKAQMNEIRAAILDVVERHDEEGLRQSMTAPLDEWLKIQNTVKDAA